MRDWIGTEKHYLPIKGWLALSLGVLASCGGGVGGSSVPSPSSPGMPVFSTTAAQNGAVILTISSTSSGATVHYTIDGSSPTTSSPTYQTPMLISSDLTLKAIAPFLVPRPAAWRVGPHRPQSRRARWYGPTSLPTRPAPTPSPTPRCGPMIREAGAGVTQNWRTTVA